VSRNAFDVSLEVLSDGFVCDAALSEWMARLQAEGLRYCPIAQEQITASCLPEEPEEGEPEDPKYDPDEDEDLPPDELSQSDGVPGEPGEFVPTEIEVRDVESLPLEEEEIELVPLDVPEIEEIPSPVPAPQEEEIIVPPEVEVITVHYELRSAAPPVSERPDYDARSLADARRAGALWRSQGQDQIRIENSPPATGAAYLIADGWTDFISLEFARASGYIA